MSKLNFKEHYYSDENIDDPSTDEEQDAFANKGMIKKSVKKVPIVDLIDDDASFNDSTVSNKKRVEDSDMSNVEHDTVILGTDNDSGVENVDVSSVKKKKKKRNKKKKKSSQAGEISETNTVNNDSEAVIDEVVESTTPQKEIMATGWLGSFLKKKRTLEIAPPPDIEVSHDTYLRSFNEGFDKTESESESEDETLPVMTAIPLVDEEIMDEEIEEQNNSVKLTFYNLPYSVTEKELLQFGIKYGYALNNVKIGFDKKKNAPSGSATAEVSTEIDVNACVSALHNKSVGGRPVRVTRSGASNDARRRLSGVKDGSRYFVNDISVKCQSCGEVGHKQFECNNEAIPTPCHLCAGKDHEAMNCPNITCFRCGLFGHHSRDCKNDRNSRPLLCSQCGSTMHDAKYCKEAETGGSRSRHDSRIEGKWIKCISCNQFGHTMCHSLPKLSNYKGLHEDVYCPNCGEKGHHIDFPHLDQNNRNGGGGTCCKAPKYDAFVRFSKLWQDTEDMSGADKNEYYRELLKNASYNDRQLFPSLSSTGYTNNNYNNYNNNNNNNNNIYNNSNDRGGIRFQDAPNNRPNSRFNDRRDDSQYDGYNRSGCNNNNYNQQQSRHSNKRSRDYTSDSDNDDRDYHNRKQQRHSSGGEGRVVYQENIHRRHSHSNFQSHNNNYDNHNSNYNRSNSNSGRQGFNHSNSFSDFDNKAEARRKRFST